MTKLKAAMISTGFMPPELDRLDTLDKFAAMGYKGFETLLLMRSIGVNYSKADVLKKLQQLNMPILTASFFAWDEPDIPALINECHELGVTRATAMASGITMAISSGKDIAVYPYDAAMREIEHLEKTAAALKKEGIVTCFHNHHAELLKNYKGVPYYYLMAAYTDDLKFELDAGWATAAGFDPVKIMEQLGDRLCALHIKDYVNAAPNANFQGVDSTVPQFTTPGTGELNLRGVLQKASEMGLDYAIVEQDFMNVLDPLSAAQAAYLNMKETGFVE